VAAELEDLIVHDLRRSVVKNLNDAGIPRELAKLFHRAPVGRGLRPLLDRE
jgi:hypothetical protein